MKIETVGEKEFEEIIKSFKVVVVDFFMEGCGPCKTLKPILDGLVDKYGKAIIFCAIDLGHSPGAMVKYGIRGVPTVKLFIDGKEADSKTGSFASSVYEHMIDKAL